MKLPLLALALLPLALTGCQRAVAQNSAPPEPAPAAVYKAQRGIQFSDLALQATGVHVIDVMVRTGTGSPAGITVPAEAVLRTLKGDFVYVANGDWFLRTPVVLGAAGTDGVTIAEGLYEGDRIVSAGTRSIWLAELQAINGGVGCADGH